MKYLTFMLSIVLGIIFQNNTLFAQDSNPIDTLIYKVQGNCDACKTRIETEAILAPGVLKASYNIQEGELTVKIHKATFSERGLHKRIAKSGHDTNLKKAPIAVYNSLPSCCKYREGNPHETAIQKEIETLPSFEDISPEEKLDKVSGMIYEKDEYGNKSPLIGATVSWLGTTQGSTSDLDGHFSLQRIGDTEDLVISYVSYLPDTINMAARNMVSIVLSNAITLDGVEVVHRKKTTEISYLNPIKVQKIGEKELLKAACCNVAESFETTPAVDVSFTDAITGTRKIQLLGLEGPYVQIMRENMPYIRGLAAIYGLSYTPGPWLQGMQLNLGAGSVANGYEGFTGQINLELKKPEDMDKLYLNLYANEGGRTELNALIRHDLPKKWFSGTLLHGKYDAIERDRNNDNFLDGALSESVIALHRWKFYGDDGFLFQFGIKGTYLDKVSGQKGYKKIENRETTSLWGSNIETKRMEGWAKFGKVFDSNPFKSIGVQLSGALHNQDAIFGDRTFDASHNSFYSNVIFQNILSTSAHKYKVGMGFQFDDFEEQILLQEYKRDERVPGAFAEYTFSHLDKLNIVAGVRGDFHNIYGFFATPRIHLRYAPNEDLVIRAAAGRAQRTAAVFAENLGLFASNRSILLLGDSPSNYPYQLNPEVAWNFGLNMSKSIKISDKEIILGVDYYYTFFEEQVIVDFDNSPTSVSFYNLDGESYSHSIQSQIDMEILPRWDLRLAYRFNNVKTQYLEGVLDKPLVSRHRAFLNTAYSTKDDWSFDFTLNWQGAKRIPGTQNYPVDYPNQLRMDKMSPSFVVINTQVSKSFGKLELYLGAENLFNYRQSDPILSSENPDSEYFDGSLIWGPVFGRNVYGGIRLGIGG